MITVKNLFAAIAYATLLVCGCSQPDTALNEPAQQAAKTAQPAVESSNSIARPAGDQQGDSQDKAPTPTAPLTSMNLSDGVSREYQNGPTKEETEKYRQLINKRAAPRKNHRPEQTNDPVFDSEMVQVSP
jgi:hypothetical protein